MDGRVSVVTSSVLRGRFGHEPGQHGGRIPAAMRCFEWCTGLRGPGASSKAAVSGATVSAEEAVKATLIRHGLHCAQRRFLSGLLQLGVDLLLGVEAVDVDVVCDAA
ncbi:hypothetical protein ACWD5Q_34525, partial [Streptomyces sp. NPDC002513]